MSTDWRKVVRGSAGGSMERCQTKPLIDGADYFSALASDLQSTSSGTDNREEYFIYVLAWMLDVDLPLVGKKHPLLDLLTKAAGNDVEVRVLVWENPIYFAENHDSIKKINKINGTLGRINGALGLIDDFTFSTATSRSAVREIKKTIGGLVNTLSDLGLAQNLPELKGRMPPDRLLKIKSVGSHHDKTFVINGPSGLVAYCGGMDINKNRLSSQHDIQCRVEGMAAWELLQKFVLRWQALMTTASVPSFDVPKALTLRGSATTKPAPLPQKTAAPFVRAIGIYNPPLAMKAHKRPNRDLSARSTILAAIDKAERYIYIEDQYMTSLSVADALHKAMKRGVQRIVMLMQSSELSYSDILMPNRKRADFIDTVLYGRIKDGTGALTLMMSAAHQFHTLSPPNTVAVYEMSTSAAKAWHEFVHSKIYIIDDEIMIIGSFNCNNRGLTHDSESGVVIVDEKRKKQKSFVAEFRQKLWMHHLDATGGRPSKEQVELRKWIGKISNPIDSSLYWDFVSPTIEPYVPKGKDIDVVLEQLIHAGIKKMTVKEAEFSEFLDPVGHAIRDIKRGFKGGASQVLQNVLPVVKSKRFRDFVWDLVDPHEKP